MPRSSAAASTRRAPTPIPTATRGCAPRPAGRTPSRAAWRTPPRARPRRSVAATATPPPEATAPGSAADGTTPAPAVLRHCSVAPSCLRVIHERAPPPKHGLIGLLRTGSHWPRRDLVLVPL